MIHVGYDQRAITFNGKRVLLLSGAIHYPRSTPSMWSALMEHSRQAGLNTIETYVFWSLHERQRGSFDFSGRLDLLHFCQLAQQHGLSVILRIGPYICAETNYGGLPSWLHTMPGLRMRTYNNLFMQEMERWVHFLCKYLQPMFASNGGSIILAQIENEYDLVAANYGEEGQRYLQWSLELGQSLNLGIPLIMCVGSTSGALETMNGFYGHTQLDRHFRMHPDQPALWTEHWTGWYDTFGHPHHTRSPQDVAYATARFFAAGGAGMNYYMWHGGTNFGREAGYLMTTSYDYDAPLDELGQPTTKLNHLKCLHQILHTYEDILLANKPAVSQLLGVGQTAYVYEQDGRSLVFLCNDDTEISVTVSYQDRPYHLPAKSVTILDGEQPLFNSAIVDPTTVIQREMQPLSQLLTPFIWQAESIPDEWPGELRAVVTDKHPVDQLELTADETDYCWYTTSFVVSPEPEREGMLVLEGVADVVHVFVDGQFVATTELPLLENRGPIKGAGFTQSFTLALAPGTHKLSLLCCALGCIKGDWMIGNQNMREEKKGLWGQVSWNGVTLMGPWAMRSGLLGEREGVFDQQTSSARWQSTWQSARGHTLRWWRTTFNRPQGNGPFAIDLRGMCKGLAWLNGRCIGRYWLTPGVEQSETPPEMTVNQEYVGKSTQRYYHLPIEWLADDNILVLFEELGGDPSLVQVCVWKGNEV